MEGGGRKISTSIQPLRDRRDYGEVQLEKPPTSSLPGDLRRTEVKKVSENAMGVQKEAWVRMLAENGQNPGTETFVVIQSRKSGPGMAKQVKEYHTVDSLAALLSEGKFVPLKTRSTAWIGWPGIPLARRNPTNSTVYALQVQTGDVDTQRRLFKQVEERRLQLRQE